MHQHRNRRRIDMSRVNVNALAAVTAALWIGCANEAPVEVSEVVDEATRQEMAALIAASEASADTTAYRLPDRAPPAIPWDDMTALQRHVAYFDWNGDGLITVVEDYQGLRGLGIDPVLSTTFATFINGLLGTPTRGFPSLTIDLRGIASGVHGSDSGIYDSEGRFVAEAFERLFLDWDLDDSGGLDPIELAARTIRDADLFDVFGVAISGAEFGLLFAVAAEDGELSRARMRAFYDGTLFYTLADEREGRWPWSWWWD
jgi:peroxygenase